MTVLTEEATKKSRIRNCLECRGANLVENREKECAVCIDCGFVISAETAKCSSGGRTNADLRKCVHSTSRSDQLKSFVKKKESVRENMSLVLEKWRNVRVADSTEKSLALGLQYITEMVVDLSLPKTVLEKASLMYKKIIDRGLLKGRSMRAVSATVVYVGCRQCRIAVTIKDIAHASKMSPREIGHSYRSIEKRLDIPMQPTTTSNHATELSTRLQVSTRTMEVLEKTIEALDCSKGFVGKAPTGIAGAALYISSLLTGERRTQREIAEAARITEATIRARCRELERSFIFTIHL